MSSFNARRHSFVKTILAFTAAAVMLAGCAGITYTEDADEIRAMADAITTYTVPQGYSEEFAAELMGYQMVNLQGPLPSCHIYLVQAPEDFTADVDKLQQQARDMEGGKGLDQSRDMRVVEEREVSLRGETVILLVREGRNSEDLPYREASAAFTGRGGMALLSISSPVEQWDWDLVEQFIASFS